MELLLRFIALTKLQGVLEPPWDVFVMMDCLPVFNFWQALPFFWFFLPLFGTFLTSPHILEFMHLHIALWWLRPFKLDFLNVLEQARHLPQARSLYFLASSSWYNGPVEFRPSEISDQGESFLWRPEHLQTTLLPSWHQSSTPSYGLLIRSLAWLASWYWRPTWPCAKLLQCVLPRQTESMLTLCCHSGVPLAAVLSNKTSTILTIWTTCPFDIWSASSHPGRGLWTTLTGEGWGRKWLPLLLTTADPQQERYQQCFQNGWFSELFLVSLPSTSFNSPLIGFHTALDRPF